VNFDLAKKLFLEVPSNITPDAKAILEKNAE
jgi:hypothetical protein